MLVIEVNINRNNIPVNQLSSSERVLLEAISSVEDYKLWLENRPLVSKLSASLSESVLKSEESTVTMYLRDIVGNHSKCDSCDSIIDTSLYTLTGVYISDPEFYFSIESEADRKEYLFNSDFAAVCPVCRERVVLPRLKVLRCTAEFEDAVSDEAVVLTEDTVPEELMCAYVSPVYAL